MPIVDIGNGYDLDLPDDFTPDQISAAVHKTLGTQPKADKSYDTKLAPDEETKFQSWKQQNAPKDSGADYDLRGAFKAGLTPAANGHWPDTFKKPNHPTFSNESQYAVGDDAAKAGSWTGPNHDVYVPPKAAGSTPADTVDAIKAQPTDKAAARARRSALADAALQAYSATLGVGQGFFGAGDYAGAAGKMVHGLATGQPLGPQAAFDAARADREAVQAQAPAAAIVGDVGGALASGRALAKVAPSLIPQAGQLVRNVGRLALGGAAAGGIQAAGESEFDPTQIEKGAAVGAVTGPLAAGGLKAVQLAGRGLKNAAISTATALAPNAMRGIQAGEATQAGIRALASRLQESPEALQNAMDEFRAATGHAPSIAEIISAGSADNLAGVAKLRRGAGEVFQQNAEEATEARPVLMQKQIRKGGPVTSRAQEVTEQSQDFGNAVEPIRGNIVTLPTTPNATTGQPEIDLPPKLMRAIADDVNLNADPAHRDLLENGQVTIGTLDNVRKALNKQNVSKPGRGLDTMAGQARQMAEDAEPQYGQALSTYSARARRIKGVNAGLREQAPEDAGNVGTINDLATPEGQGGLRVGTRTRLSNEAGSSQAGAVKLAKELAEPRGAVASDLRGTLGPAEQQRLQRMGTAEATSAERLKTITPKLSAPADETNRTVQAAVEGAVAAGGRALTGFIIHAARRVAQEASISPAVAKRVAELASDPKNAPQAIALLRKAKVSEDRIKQIFLQSAAAVGGAAGGQAQ